MLTDPQEPPHARASSSALAAKALAIGLVTTAVVTVLSYALPDPHKATGVGLVFLAATYVLVLRSDGDKVRRYGLALAGLLEPEPLSAQRLVVEGARALLVAFVTAALVFPPFWFGWLAWWKPEAGFVPVSPRGLLDETLGQLLVIALPEEAFYRGYLQSALDEAWTLRVRLFGARVGPALVATSALFALGHLATDVNPARLGVFFPALLFGWLRARTGGIGAGLAFHALCNLFASYLARSYGLA